MGVVVVVVVVVVVGVVGVRGETDPAGSNRIRQLPTHFQTQRGQYGIQWGTSITHMGPFHSERGVVWSKIKNKT